MSCEKADKAVKHIWLIYGYMFRLSNAQGKRGFRGVSLNDARNTRDKTKPPGIVLTQDYITGMTTEDTQEV